jgi:hypothetical protein
MIVEQTRPETSPSEGHAVGDQPETPQDALEPADALAAQAHMDWGDAPRRPTWQEYEAEGIAAYTEAVEREEEHGLDEATVARYRAASVNLINAHAEGPIDHKRRELEKPDPVHLMMIAGSLAKQAQAAEVESYSTYGSRNIDRRSNLQRISTETMQRASRMMMGNESYADYAALFAEHDAESPAELVVSAVVGAAKETGTAKHVHGTEAVDKNISERLKDGGEDAVVNFIGEHAMESSMQGPEFVARTAEIVVEAVEEITGEHKLPAPEQPEVVAA